MQWPDFKFPPINLHTVWPSQEMQELHGELLNDKDADLWQEEQERQEDGQ